MQWRYPPWQHSVEGLLRSGVMVKSSSGVVQWESARTATQCDELLHGTVMKGSSRVGMIMGFCRVVQWMAPPGQHEQVLQARHDAGHLHCGIMKGSSGVAMMGSLGAPWCWRPPPWQHSESQNHTVQYRPQNTMQTYNTKHNTYNTTDTIQHKRQYIRYKML